MSFNILLTMSRRLILAGHINNLYNTTFWALIQQGDMTNQEAEKALAVGDVASIKTNVSDMRSGYPIS